MDASVKKISDTQVEIIIKLGQAELAPIVRQVFNTLRPKVKADGFRTGRAPNEIIERELGVEAVQGEVIEAAAQKYFRQTAAKNDIRPLAPPHVELQKFVPYTTLELKLAAEVMPPIKLPDYKKFKHTTQPIEVTAEEVDRVIDGLRIRSARRTDVKRPAKTGDEVLIDFEGSHRGQAIPGAESRDYPAIIGSNRLVPGFEDQLIGLKAGDRKEFKITFPKDYGETTLQGQPVDFTVTVKKVVELELPTVDDKLAADVGPFKTVKDLRANIETQIRAEKELAADRELEHKAVNQLVDKTKISLPPKLVEQQLHHLAAGIDQQLSKRGLSRDQYLEQEKKTEADLNRELEPEAAKRVKTSLVLSELARVEKLKVTPEEIEAQVELLRGRYNDKQVQTELDKPEVRRDIANQLLAEKTVAKLVEYARS